MSKIRVLAVDDDAAISELIKTGLESAGYDVDLASNEAGVWKSIEKNKPDVILMDVGMPDIDGISLCRSIRFSPELSNIPIIILSAFTDQKTYHDAMFFGAYDFIAKPFELAEVQRKIEESIKKINSEPENK